MCSLLISSIHTWLFVSKILVSAGSQKKEGTNNLCLSELQNPTCRSQVWPSTTFPTWVSLTPLSCIAASQIRMCMRESCLLVVFTTISKKIGIVGCRLTFLLKFASFSIFISYSSESYHKPRRRSLVLLLVKGYTNDPAMMKSRHRIPDRSENSSTKFSNRFFSSHYCSLPTSK